MKLLIFQYFKLLKSEEVNANYLTVVFRIIIKNLEVLKECVKNML